VDIGRYLQLTTQLDSDVDYSDEAPLLDWLTGSLSELALDIDVVSASTFDASHRFLTLSKRQYIVWDVALNRTVLALLIGMQYVRLAHSDAVQGDELRARAESHLRSVLFTYLARKLRRYPHTSAAFAWLASEHPACQLSVLPEADVIRDIFNIQRMLMYYHEVAHAFFLAHPSMFEQCAAKTRISLDHIEEFTTDPERFSSEHIEAYFPEFSADSPERRLGRYVEELACDYQAFILTGMAVPASRVISARAWQDCFGLLFGASEMLATIERTLKLAALKWTTFARATGDGAQLTDESLHLADFVNERPMATLRRWHTILALQRCLSEVGSALDVDAYEWQEYIIEKFSGMKSVLQEYLLGQINAMAVPEFVAKVFARANVHRMR
jgi:hypothetical protein